MAEVEPVLFVPGEVRKIEKKRDFTDKVTGEFRPGKGRKVEVLTYGGFLTVSVGEAFDEYPIHEGDVVLWKVRALPWKMARPARGDEPARPDLVGTAYLLDGPVMQSELDALAKAGALHQPVKA